MIKCAHLFSGETWLLLVWLSEFNLIMFFFFFLIYSHDRLKVLHEGGEEIQHSCSLFSVFHSEYILQLAATIQTNVHPGIVCSNWKHPTVRLSQQQKKQTNMQQNRGYTVSAWENEQRQFKMQLYAD